MKEDIFGIEPVIHSGDFVPLKYEDIYKVIETVMGLDPAVDLEGIQIHGPNPRRVDVLTKTNAVWYDKNLFDYMNLEYEPETGLTVLITRPYEDYKVVKVVRVKRIPIW